MNARSSSAHVYFDRIVAQADPAAYLRSLVGSVPPTQETEWLDFKGNAPDADVSRIWSKALSGFANTEGGVIIWGIDARKDSTTNVDAANSLRLIANPSAFRSRLMELHHQATDPPVAGVEIREYVDPSDGTGAGFVVCLIPESGYKPHRSENEKNKPYYIRAGDDFVIPSPALLRHLFFPHTNSQLWVEIAVGWKALQQKTSPQEWKTEIEVTFKSRLHNSGTATAKDVYVVLQTSTRFDSFVTHADWRESSNPQGFKAFEAERAIHPGAVLPVFDAIQKLNPMTIEGEEGNSVVPDAEDVSFRFLMYAADREPQVAKLTFDRAEIIGKATKRVIGETGHWHREIPTA